MHCYFYCSMFILMSEKRQLGQQLLLRRPRGTGHSNFVLKFARHYVLHDFYNTHEKNYFLAYLRYHILCNRWVFGKILLWEKDPLAMLCSRLYSKKERMDFILFKKVVRIGIAEIHVKSVTMIVYCRHIRSSVSSKCLSLERNVKWIGNCVNLYTWIRSDKQ